MVHVAPYRSKLTVSGGGNTVFSQEVGLMYTAQFGPDVADAAEWKKTVIDFIDQASCVQARPCTQGHRKAEIVTRFLRTAQDKTTAGP